MIRISDNAQKVADARASEERATAAAEVALVEFLDSLE